MLGQVWWCTPLIPALGRQKQVDLCEFKARLVYMEFQDSQGYTEKHTHTHTHTPLTKQSPPPPQRSSMLAY